MYELDRSAIKRDARAFIGQDNRWWFMFVAYLPILAIGIVSSIGLSIYEFFSLNRFAMQISDGGSSLLNILLIPFEVAFCGFFLNHLRGFSPNWKSVYQEGFDRYGDYLLVGFVTGLIIGIWSLFLIVPGIIAALSYSQVYYVLHDNPQVSCKRAREISSALTDGCKWDLFVLELSFIGWWLLVALTAGIAFIYVWPYYQTTKAMYYENLKAYAISTGRIAPEVFSPMPQGGAWAQGQNPYVSPQQPPYTAPQQANPYTQQPAAPQGEPGNTFTPPAPEDTFRPWDVPPGTGQTPPQPARSAQPTQQTSAPPVDTQTGETINREEKEQDE